MKKSHISLAVAAFVAAVVLGNGLLQLPADTPPVAQATQVSEISNVYMENGLQIIEIAARGGYSPGLSTAKASVPSVLRIVTSDTFDCSSSVIIPALNIRQRLPLTGKTDIAIAAPAANSTLKAHCGMGMYSFDVTFTS